MTRPSATEVVDAGSLLIENALLRDRLLRALAEAENTRRRADRTAEEARKFAIADFARELLIVVDNLQRTIDAADGHAPSAAENASLIEGVRATLRVFCRRLIALAFGGSTRLASVSTRACTR
jgi:molecular chaperone GrpE